MHRNNLDSLRGSVSYIRFIANAFRVSSRPLSYNSFETRNITGISLIQSPPRARECLSTLYRISPRARERFENIHKEGNSIGLAGASFIGDLFTLN